MFFGQAKHTKNTGNIQAIITDSDVVSQNFNQKT